MLLFKLIIIILFLFAAGSLFSALFFLNKDKGESTRTLTMLKVRIGLSVLIFILLIIGFSTGLLQPHGIVPPH